MQQTLIQYQVANNKIKSKPHRSFGLDLARSIAITFVIIAHFANQFNQFGFWGVELFFSLSGFLIGQILWKSYAHKADWDKSKIFNFWARRWWRTLPNYYLFFIVSLFFHNYIMNGVPDLPRLSQFLWFRQDLLHRGGEFFGVSWSLCVEEWFYFLFPLVLYCANKFIPLKRHSFLVTIFIFFIACFTVREVLIHVYHETKLREVTFARLDAIACGVLLAFLNTTIHFNKKVRLNLFLSGLALLVVVFVLRKDEYKLEPFLLLLAPLAFSFLLPFLSNMDEPGKAFNFLSNSIQKISLWSYSIYLTHIPIMFTVYKLTDSFRSSVYNNILSKMIALVITLIVSSILFKYFELPLTKKRPIEIKR